MICHSSGSCGAIICSAGTAITIPQSVPAYYVPVSGPVVKVRKFRFLIVAHHTTQQRAEYRNGHVLQPVMGVRKLVLLRLVSVLFLCGLEPAILVPTLEPLA